MESSVACQLFQRAPAKGIKYDQYIGDDDSTTFPTSKQMFPMALKKFLISSTLNAHSIPGPTT